MAGRSLQCRCSNMDQGMLRASILGLIAVGQAKQCVGEVTRSTHCHWNNCLRQLDLMQYSLRQLYQRASSLPMIEDEDPVPCGAFEDTRFTTRESAWPV
jgi:hypothetical protein